MIYPKFLKKGDLIGITAPSQGIKHKEESFDKSLNNLKKEFRIIETNNVRTNGIVSSSKEIRVKELNDLIKNDISSKWRRFDDGNITTSWFWFN